MPDAALLHKRYEILRKIGQSAGTVSYAAFDAVDKTEIELRAFFSENIMRLDTDAVSAVPGCEVQYKALTSDYEELCRFVMNLPAACPAVRPTDVFIESGTAWAVYPIGNLERLDDYLARCGVIGYGAMKRAMSPIVGLIEQMHARGILHRGISDKTIFVTEDGKFILSGFAVAPARTVGSEIESELFFGYSAPEQYSSSSWQGTWTDVYSLAAVCYRLVTGITPVEWRQRSEKHSLASPDTLSATLPEYVAKAIMRGLQVELAERYRTVDELWSGILEEPGGSTIRYAVSEIPRRRDTPQETASRHLPWILVSVLALAVLCLAAVLLSRRLAEKYIIPPIDSRLQSDIQIPESEQEEETPQLVIPDFVDANVEDVLLNSLYRQLFDFEIERSYSEEKPAGIIIGQAPKAQTVYTERVTVTLTVSRGSERITMPDIIGLSYEQAIALLSEAEITYEVSYVEGTDGVGTVISADAPTGSIIYRTRDIVTIFICTDSNNGQQNH